MSSPIHRADEEQSPRIGVGSDFASEARARRKEERRAVVAIDRTRQASRRESHPRREAHEHAQRRHEGAPAEALA